MCKIFGKWKSEGTVKKKKVSVRPSKLLERNSRAIVPAVKIDPKKIVLTLEKWPFHNLKFQFRKALPNEF